MMNLTTLQDWFEDHLSFSNLTELISIANGVTASDEPQVNCDEAEQIGNKIHQPPDDVKFKISKIKCIEQVKTMASLQNSVKIRDRRSPNRPNDIVFTFSGK